MGIRLIGLGMPVQAVPAGVVRSADGRGSSKDPHARRKDGG